MRYMVKKCDEVATVRQGKLELEEMHKVVGGYIEPFTFDNGKYCMIGDEEAKLKGKAPNIAMMYGGQIFDTMNGTIIILRNGGEDFETLTDEDIDFLHNKFTFPQKAIVYRGAFVPVVEV